MAVLEARGVFWWHDEPVPDVLLAPDAHVFGALKIDEVGRISLELDGYLANEHGPMAAIVTRQERHPEKRCIQGLLKDTSQRVLLLNLIRNGGQFNTNGISYERFSAMDCLVGNSAFLAGEAVPKIRELEVQLDGFEDWLRLGSIETVKRNSALSAKYKKPKDAVYAQNDGRLSINYHIAGEPFPGKHRTSVLSLKESASLVWKPKRPSLLEDLKTKYSLLEDLFILLTDSDYCLEWPIVSLNKDRHCKWYFLRHGSKQSAIAPKWHECWTNFVQLRSEFGSIWSNWQKKHGMFGAGFYLYLGTRRGLKLYEEHRFVNLIWGIEAFHRTKHSATISDRLAKKIERVIGQVSAPKDQKWLRERLSHAHEPALAQRMFDAFKTLPIGIEEGRLREFCNICAKLRNDISHFGRPQNVASSASFIDDLDKRSTALATLYHTLLLHEIGVDAKILRHWIYESFRSFPIKHSFVEVGLLDKSVLQPLNPKQIGEGRK
ncbi:HEPN domain-containing protein [Bradyrhizobium cytisi]|uniref:Uncharacterized protein n=1 Tax=Bradyrhizobium cytisi TaxID=515489 RepID=A0A5S4WYN6_9BRAD|nr:HEPN domain-containing protein [Bradyrhizobium cytisi]TYL85802.1 hypothetical protein FXB38_09660 [Bradyrhizobium cytisi]